MVAGLSVRAEELGELCRRWKVTGLALFGSALRDDFVPDSDIDLLVTFSPDADWSLLDHIRMQQELASLLGRRVDLVSRRAIERSANPLRRRQILSDTRTLCVARPNDTPGHCSGGAPDR